MRPSNAVEVIRGAVEGVMRDLKSFGVTTLIDGRFWLELIGCVVNVEVVNPPRSEEEARLFLTQFDPVLMKSFEAEAEDYRVHSAELRRLFRVEERTSRRVVSVLPPPKCPTAIQILRDREPTFRIVGFMRSERVMPLLPLDVLNYLWAVGSALPDAVVDGEVFRLTLVVGSLHLELPW
jgi:hypothetical protein